MEQFWLLRIDSRRFIEERFCQAVDKMKGTKYHLSARYEDAPRLTHCVSAVRYIFEETTQNPFPYYYIGDMCRRILDERSLWARLVPLHEWEMGDLIFFCGRARRYQRYMIHHVGVLIDDSSFFHSTYGKWWVIDSIEKAILKWNIATCKILNSYTDHRQ